MKFGWSKVRLTNARSGVLTRVFGGIRKAAIERIGHQMGLVQIGHIRKLRTISFTERSQIDRAVGCGILTVVVGAAHNAQVQQ